MKNKKSNKFKWFRGKVDKKYIKEVIKYWGKENR